jgi:DNA ligase (NAD+)
MQRVQELEEKLKYHKALYYQGRPVIPDHEYDELESKLKKLNPESPVLKMVGTIVSGANKVRHTSKMLSLGKTYKTDELTGWMADHECVSMLKIDGVSCSLIFKDKKLVIAKTRGDGKMGENITPKVIWMDSVPKEILTKGELEVRGELYCDESSFVKLSDEMLEIGLEKPTSQRNIVAGLIGRKENIELARHIKFKAFEYITDHGALKLETEKFKKLIKDGFDVTEIAIHKNTKNVNDAIDDARRFMSEGDYQIDGLVFVYNDLALHEELGATAHHPRFKMAFKFQGESKQTKIKKIIWGVSRNGILTPVADVEPVELSGALISRVTLHNYGMTRQHELKSGDTIEIIRSGEVIPKFMSVVKSAKGKFERPIKCPSCNEKVFEDDIRLVCRNSNCPDKVKEEILNFIQKIGIDDLSSKRLEEMIRAGLIKTIDDLYKLKKPDLMALDKVKDKLATKLLDSIENSKNADIITFLASLGISGGAFNKCEKVVRGGFDTIDKIKDLTVEKLMEVESFAEKSATEFITSFNSKTKLVDKLLKQGFNFESSGNSSDTVLSGRKVCITGSLSEKRSVVEGKIREAGGIVVGSVSKNTHYLLTNDEASGSSKTKKAQSLDISIITEVDLANLIG